MNVGLVLMMLRRNRPEKRNQLYEQNFKNEKWNITHDREICGHRCCLRKKILLHRVFDFGNPSKYVPRVTGLNFLDQARRSAILIPRWLTIAVALWKRTRIMVFIGKWTFPCSVANLSAFQKVVSPSVRYTSWVLHQGLIRRDHIHSHCRSNWEKGPLPFL